MQFQTLTFLSIPGRLGLLAGVFIAATMPGWTFPDSFARRGEQTVCVPGIGQPLCDGVDRDCDGAVDSCEEWVSHSPFGSSGIDTGEIKGAWGLTQDGDGNLIVSDTAADRVATFNPDGIFIRQFGTPGTLSGELDGPWRSAIDSAGDIYVLDRENDRIQKFSPSGDLLLEIPREGDTVEFRSLHGIDVDLDGFIYVTENFLGIAKFDPAGNLVATWGKDGPGEIGQGLDIAIGPDRSVYVVDFFGDVVKRYDENGTYLNSIGGSWAFFLPAGIAVDEDGVIYVVDWQPSVRTFESDGTALSVFDPSTSGLSPMALPVDIVPGPDETVYVSGGNDIVQFTRHGELLNRFGRPEVAPGEALNLTDVFLDENGRIYTVDTALNKVLTFSSSGALLTEWSLPPGQYSQVNLEVSPATGELFVRNGYEEILRFAPGGTLLDRWTDPTVDSVAAMAIDRDGYVVVLENSLDVFRKFNAAGSLLAEWPVGDGTSTVVAGALDIDPNGSLYVLNGFEYEILVHDQNGAFLRRIQLQETERPRDLAVADDGTLYVLYQAEIIHADSDGDFLRSYPGLDVMGIAYAANRLYLANSRLAQVERLGCRQPGHWYFDGDSDGYGTRELSLSFCGPLVDFVGRSGDCEDRNPTIHPGATEICDGLDNDCDFLIDDSFPGSDNECSQTAPGSFVVCSSGLLECLDGSPSAPTSGIENSIPVSAIVQDAIEAFRLEASGARDLPEPGPESPGVIRDRSVTQDAGASSEDQEIGFSEVKRNLRENR